MGQVLGRVTGGGLNVPRGPDVSHRVKVPSTWLDEGLLIEVELPRHLRCAACDGGGCDTCERSGALTVRGRGEPAEIVEVRLPQRGPESATDSRPITIRIPELGGLPAEGEDLPRGHLLLGVIAAAEADPSVRLLEPAPAPVLAPVSVPGPVVQRAPTGRPSRTLLWALIVLFWIALLAWLRLTGRA
jgi:hypothetical protein